MRAIYRSIPILLAVFFTTSCKKEDPGPNGPLILNVVSGGYQAGDDGQMLPEPIVISLTNAEGNPLPGIPLEFSIVIGGGNLSPGTKSSRVLTEEGGLAQVRWVLGHDSDHILKVALAEPDGFTEPVYVFAQTDVQFNMKWTSGHRFPPLFGQYVSHDDRILETSHYLIFSDESSDDAKVRFAKVAEETLHEVFNAFSISESSELGILQDNSDTKPKLFSNVNTSFPYGGFAFRTGYVYYAFDCAQYESSPYLREGFRADVKHETVHVLSFLCGLDNLPNLWPDVWFSEGIAVYISNNRPPPANLAELEEWRSIPANDNPIKVHEWEDLPSGGRRYYNMFGLAVEYLLSENGQGKTTGDVLDMYRWMFDTEEGFARAFELHMGMSLQYYEDNYWDLITAWLSTRN